MKTWLRHDGVYVSGKPPKYIIAHSYYPPHEPIYNTDKYFYIKFNMESGWRRLEMKNYSNWCNDNSIIKKYDNSKGY